MCWLIVVAVIVLAPTYTHGVWNTIVLAAVMLGIGGTFAAPVAAIVALAKGERAGGLYLGFAPVVCSVLFDYVLNPIFGWLT